MNINDYTQETGSWVDTLDCRKCRFQNAHKCDYTCPGHSLHVHGGTAASTATKYIVCRGYQRFYRSGADRLIREYKEKRDKKVGNVRTYVGETAEVLQTFLNYVEEAGNLTELATHFKADAMKVLNLMREVWEDINNDAHQIGTNLYERIHNVELVPNVHVNIDDAVAVLILKGFSQERCDNIFRAAARMNKHATGQSDLAEDA